MQFQTDELTWQESYKLLVGSIVPRPIALVSTVSASGVQNLAAFSFFTAVCARPLTIAFSPTRRNSGEKKDTLRNIEDTRQFVVNVVTEDIVEAVNQTAPEFSPEVDEFAISGLTPVTSVCVAPPRVAESPIQMECDLVETVTLGELPGGGSLVIGRVVQLHVRDDLYVDGKIDPNQLRAVARMGGDEYCRTSQRFQLPIPHGR